MSTSEIDALRVERMEGKVGEADYFTRLEALSAAASNAPAPTLEQAQAEMQQLRADRFAGKVSEVEFQRRMDALAPSLEAPAAPKPEAPLSADEQAMLQTLIAPPERPEDYDLPGAADATEPEHREWMDQVRGALHGLEIPQTVAGRLCQSADDLAVRFATADPETIMDHLDEVETELRAKWGNGFEGKVKAIMDALGKTEGPVGKALKDAPWLVLGDARSMESLDFVISSRARVRA